MMNRIADLSMEVQFALSDLRDTWMEPGPVNVESTYKSTEYRSRHELEDPLGHED